MTDSLERFLEDLHFEVPAGLAHRAKAAAAADERVQLSNRRDLNWQRQPLALALVAAVLALAIVAALIFGARSLHPKALVPGDPPINLADVTQVSGVGKTTTSSLPVLPEMLVGSVGWSGLNHTTDGARSWIDVSPVGTNQRNFGGPRTTSFLDVNHAWLAIPDGPIPSQPNPVPLATQVVVYATADGGQTWRYGPPVSVNLINAHFRLSFVDALKGWLVGDSGPYGIQRNGVDSTVIVPRVRDIYTTKDGGLHWTHLVNANEADGTTLGTLAPDCSMTALTFVNLQHGWLVWDCTSRLTLPTSGPQSPDFVATTQDGGRTWESVALPGLPSNGPCRGYPPVFVKSQGELTVFCFGVAPVFAAIYTTEDTGRTWTLRRMPFSGIPDFVDARTAWVTAGTSLELTTNGGQDWVLVKQFGSAKRISEKFLDAKNGFVWTIRCYPSPTTLWKTTDGGQTWSMIGTQPAAQGECM